MAHGLELEIPMLRSSDDKPATLKDARRFWTYMHKRGWEYKKDGSTKKIVGLKKKIQGKVWTLDHEYGVATIEIGTPPMGSLITLKKKWDYVMKEELLPALKANKLYLLGMSHFPTAHDLSTDKTPKGHYQIWTGMFTGKRKKELHRCAGGFCAMQYNVGVPLEKLVPLTNALTKLTHVIWGWSANSPLFDMKLQGTLSYRQKTYDLLREGKWVRDRLNVVDSSFKSLSDYVSRAWDQPMFEIIRDGLPWYQPKHTMSTWDFIKKGKGRFRNLDGKWKTFSIEPSDLNLGMYFYWPAVRIKCVLAERYSVEELVTAVKGNNVEKVLKDPQNTAFLEVRQMDLPPQIEIFSWVALIEGLLAHEKGATKMTKKWTMKEVFGASTRVQRAGLRARFKGKLLSEYAEAMLLVSEKGLQKKDARLISWLEPLAKRLYLGKSPGRESKELFEKEGMGSVLHSRRFV